MAPGRVCAEAATATSERLPVFASTRRPLSPTGASWGRSGWGVGPTAPATVLLIPRWQGTDLFAVAVHVSLKGHALGLGHSSAPDSITWGKPFTQGPVGNPAEYHLSQDDREGLQQLYGTGGGWVLVPGGLCSGIRTRPVPLSPQAEHPKPHMTSPRGSPWLLPRPLPCRRTGESSQVGGFGCTP